MHTNLVNSMAEISKIVNNSNPQSFVMSMLQTTAQRGDPMAQNLVKLVHAGNTKEIEQVARNVAKEKGIDFDKEFNSFKQMFRL